MVHFSRPHEFEKDSNRVSRNENHSSLCEITTWLSATDEKISKWDCYYKKKNITQNGGQRHRDEN